ncbi:D-alanyl-D-alanine-carboxypeptidase/endopeptidase AmpH [Martelella radicis]|uniref:D-alanyl-D-alanine-carboxypeptidase/D-alanyl-D-alanine-endopeptidase n=1 Tax=Martelella radicis TaxID=1397476 RepID=A0A7W6P9D6_9HYPH|nr:D-alanyl-D-alanine-carboxypeptidase/endopeptidase AmpH [Martelella radicis]MBB4121705.1 D-alanyl-D-alanine-carboxypeptidase/D-alanyl-D-alanine-endopeptidase [Martelella radicis]
MRYALAALAIFTATSASANDPLLDDAVEFTGQIFHLDTGVPGLVIAAVRGDESAVFGFGEVAKGSGREPDADTVIGVGSVTKTFTGLSLASLAANGTVSLTDSAGPHAGVVDALPEKDGRAIRLIDLATHSSGLPRELAPVDGAEKYSDASFAANLSDDPLLFAPGTGILYSNVGFDVLAMSLSDMAGAPYADLLKSEVLDPIGLTSTGYARPQGENAMVGYDWNGNEMDPGDPIANRQGASGLYTTANDMLQYLRWNLDRFGENDAEARALSHAAWLIRDGLDPVYGMDESGHMNAMGLGWVIMMPENDRPLIIQKAGGTNGVFSYLAFAPTRGVGVFISINQFNFSASMEMAQVVNELIATLAPR